MSQQKNAMYTPQVGVALKSLNTSRQFPPPTEEILDIIRPSANNDSDFTLVDRKIRKPPRQPDEDRLAKRIRRKAKIERVQNKLAHNKKALDAAHAARVTTTTVVTTHRREPVTWHLPYVKPNVVDHSKRIDVSVPTQYCIDGTYYSWDELTPSQQEHMRAHATALSKQEGFASATWSSTTHTRGAKPTVPSREEKVEVRNGFVTLQRHHRVPHKVFSHNQESIFLGVVTGFLITKQRLTIPKNISLDSSIRLLNYSRTGADRLYMNSAMATIVHSNVFSLRNNIGAKAFAALVSSATIGTVNMKYGLPGPRAHTREADVLYQCKPDFDMVFREDDFIFFEQPLIYWDDYVEYQMASPGASASSGLDTVLDMMRENCPAIARIIALLYVLRATPGRYDVWAAAFVAWLSDDEAVTLTDYVRFFLTEVFPLGAIYQSGSTLVDAMISTPLAVFEKTAIYRSAWNLFGTLSIHGVLKSLGVATDSTIIGHFFKWCSPLLRREPGGTDPMDTFLAKIVRFAKVVITTVQACVIERSFAPLFSTELTFHEWMDWTNFLLFDTSLLYEPGNPAGTADFEKKLKDGEVPHLITSQMTKQDIMYQLALSITEGESILKRYEKEPVLCSAIQRHLDYVKKERIALSLDTPHGAFRIQPFGILMYGPAGVGKSRLCHDLHMACARKSGHRADASGVLRIDASANFADGAMRGQSTVLFDDIDSKPAPVTAGHDDHVSIVNKYINVTPFNIEQASIEKKGKVWAGFTLALYTTNHPDCRLSGYCTYPAMFWRRFPFRLHLKVKSTFANAAGAIDKAKLPVSGHYEPHEFHLEVYDPSMMNCGNNYVPPYKPYKIFTTKVEFFAAITELYLLHYEAEKKIAKTANEDDVESVFCETCCLPLRDHASSRKCGVELQMVPPATERRRETPSPTRKELAAIGLFGVGLGWFVTNLAIRPMRVRRNPYGGYSKDWVQWFVDCYPIRSDTTYSLFVLWPLIFGHYFGLVSWSSQIFILFFSNFLVPEVDSFIHYAFRIYLPQLEVFLWRICFAPWMRAYQSVLPLRTFTKLVRYFERYEAYAVMQRYLANVNADMVKRALAGVTLAGTAYYVWRSMRKDVPEEVLPESGLYKDYRRPPGVPVGDSPYKRVMKDELLMRAYGVRENPSTFSFPEMEAKIRERLVIVRTSLGSAHGFRISGSLIVCNAHIFMPEVVRPLARELGDDNLIPISQPRSTLPSDLAVSFVVGDEAFLIEHPLDQMYRVPGKDLVVVHVPSIPPFSSKWNFPALLCDRPPINQSMADETWLVKSDGTLVCEKPAVVATHLSDPVGPRVWRYDAQTEQGDCGSVLVIRRGATFSIAGFHSARIRGPDYCIAEALSREEFDQCLSYFRKDGAGLELQLDPKQLLGHGDLPQLVELPNKSSLRTVLSAAERAPEIIVFGTLPGLGGASSKSRVVNTMFRNHPFVEHMELSLGAHPYFTAPTFSGAMEGDRWVDPHTVSLENTMNRGGRRSIWNRALADYMRGICEKVQLGPLSPLDDYDAFFGVEDTVIGGTNMQSSAGPPFYAKKGTIIRVDHFARPRVLEWDAGFAAHLEAIEDVVRGGELYSPFCLHVLKDEAISVEKNNKHKVRVFNILPFAFNHLLKRYLGPLVALMREHAYYFESAVGFNICNPNTAEELYDTVARFPNCIAFDKSSFDARCSTEEHLVVCKFFRELAVVAGYTLEDAEIVFRLCLSAIYPVRSIKGDLFMMACSMPSGFWMTIHFNCVRSSLQSRYAWFSINPDAGPFRSSVSQIVLGDDLLATVSSSAWWFNQVSIGRALLEVGAITTSFKKATAMEIYESIVEVQFLKRNPRMVEGYRVWAIEEKTLIKMLCMRLKSAAIPERDAHAMLLSNVLSEGWMLGREVFSTLDKIVTTLAMKHGLDNNVYFRRLSFEGYLRLYASGGLTTWELVTNEGELAVPLTEIVETQLTSLQAFSSKKSVLSS